MFELIALITVIGLLLYLSYQDFWYLRLPNTTIIALTIAALAYTWSNQQLSLQANLLAAGILFAMGVAFWLFKLMGAGDAKLMLPLGLLVGLSGFLLFAVALIFFTFVLYALVKLTQHFIKGQHPITLRLQTIAEQGKVPFGIPLIAATTTVLIVQLAPFGK